MGTKDQIDACMRQAELATTICETRQTYEWRLNLALWSAIVAGAVFLPEQLALVSNCHFILAAVSIVVLHGFWVWRVTAANYYDIQWSLHYRKVAQALLIDPRVAITPAPQKGEAGDLWCYVVGNWAAQFSWIATIVLLALLYVLTHTSI